MWPRINGLRTMELGTPGRMRGELNALTLSGTKRATAGLLIEYEREQEDLETVGERMPLLDDDRKPIGMIEITGVEVVPFSEVPWSFALAEGEGFTSIEDWREVHRRYFRDADGVEVAADTPIVCLHYRLADDTDGPAPLA
ncbi:MAG: ASCH domain-containing protein [Thermomicrobiales bacterium]